MKNKCLFLRIKIPSPSDVTKYVFAKCPAKVSSTLLSAHGTLKRTPICRSKARKGYLHDCYVDNTKIYVKFTDTGVKFTDTAGVKWCQGSDTGVKKGLTQVSSV